MTNSQITALITAINDGGNNTAAEVRAVLTAIKNACVIPNEVKWIKMLNTDLTSNFQMTGSTKGLGLTGTIFEGWAWCNGNNGTANDDGRVSVAYGATYSVLDARSGSKDAVVVEHSHTLGSSGVRTLGGSVAFGGEGGNMGTLSNTDLVGVSGTDKNMMPYVVELKIQRIA